MLTKGNINPVLHLSTWTRGKVTWHCLGSNVLSENLHLRDVYQPFNFHFGQFFANFFGDICDCASNLHYHITSYCVGSFPISLLFLGHFLQC